MIAATTSGRGIFDEGLGQLEAEIQEQASSVIRAIRGARTAVRAGDVQHAPDVAALRRACRESMRRVRAASELLLARQTPVATDLRLVLAVLEINRHLDRTARNAERIVEFSLISDVVIDAEFRRRLAEAAGIGERMVEAAFRALANRDLGLALDVVDANAKVAAYGEEAFEQLVVLASDTDVLPSALRAIHAVRAVERIGDHAVAVSDEIAYVITGVHRELSRLEPPPDAD